jgi:hypothetical protein
MEKQEKGTYYGKVFTKTADQIFEEMKDPAMSKEEKITRLENIFNMVNVECINDLDRRVRKLEETRNGKK